MSEPGMTPRPEPGPRPGAAVRAGPWQRLRALPDDSPRKALLVTLAVCLLCSVLVASSVVLLRPYQIAHRQQEREARFLALASQVPGLEGLVSGLGDARVSAQVVDLDTGQIDDAIDPDALDSPQAAADPERSRALDPAEDIAGIGRRARYATVYLVREGGVLRAIVLPVYGAGYASTLRGFLALDADANTIRGLSFYEQSETPGIGDQVQDPDWLAGWNGKQLRDASGELRIRVAKGASDATAADAPFVVDGISGATRTGTGVSHLVRFWTGPQGFGPFLDRIRQEGGS